MKLSSITCLLVIAVAATTVTAQDDKNSTLRPGPQPGTLGAGPWAAIPPSRVDSSLASGAGEPATNGPMKPGSGTPGKPGAPDSTPQGGGAAGGKTDPDKLEGMQGSSSSAKDLSDGAAAGGMSTKVPTPTPSKTSAASNIVVSSMAAAAALGAAMT
ncbi:hypothetical protein ATCC90586_003661 [Pythium insidiosum]|nr:hypothetical protein ATCC90586_003661 [Pythium insidiosum]